jgi:crotonobetainyl-CoA:carnitine CoA-transferase CaiB-like acyl-CoA transferase
VRTTASPLDLSATPVSYRRCPPRLGEHTVEVLAQLANEADTRVERPVDP